MLIPCKNCICVAVCRNKINLRDMFVDCKLLWEYIFDSSYRPNRFIPRRVDKVNKVLNRRFEINIGSYGYEFIRDLDVPQPYHIKDRIHEEFGGGKDAK